MALFLPGFPFLKSNDNFTNGSDCVHGDQILWHALHQCISSKLQWASFIVGMMSVSVWLFVLLPQIYANCKNIKGVPSISWGLLICWFLGDSANLIGAVLTEQGIFQEVLGGWFVATDVIFSFQMVYYYKCYSKSEKKTGHLGNASIVLCIMGLVAFAEPLRTLLVPQSPFETSGSRNRRTLLALDMGAQIPFFLGVSVIILISSIYLVSYLNIQANIMGYILGVLSALLYTFARIFQLYKNHKLKNVSGLSRKTFILCITGNLLYGVAIFLYSTDREYLLEHAPWIVGSLGILLLDVAIVYQITVYQNVFDILLSCSVNVDLPSGEESPLISSTEEQYGTICGHH